MKKHFKKYLAVFAVTVQLLTIAPLSGIMGIDLSAVSDLFATTAQASAVSGTYGENLAWTIDTGTEVLTVSGTGRIPNSFDEKLPFALRKSFSTLKVAGEVSEIDNYAFYQCENLKTVIIENGSGVMKIGSDAFSRCPALKTVTINRAVNIQEEAFYSCTSLSQVRFNDDSNESIIGRAAFAFCSSLSDVYLPDSIVYIGAGAFSGTKIVSDPKNRDKNGVVYINNHLVDCLSSSLISYEIREGTITVAGIAFEEAYALEKVVIPSSVISIGIRAFYTGSKSGSGLHLKNVIFKENSQLKKIDTQVFYMQPIEQIDLPDSLEYIGEEAFCDTELKEIFIPAKVKIIEKNVFNSCDKLEKIIVDTSNDFYSSDSNGVLYNKDKTTLIKWPVAMKVSVYSIPDGVSVIKTNAFDFLNINNSNAKISLPDSLKIIEESAFFFFINDVDHIDIYYPGTEEQWDKIENAQRFSSDFYVIHFNHSCTYSVYETKSATCIENGYIKYVCDCGKSFMQTTAKSDCVAGSWQITTMPTTTTEGLMTQKCIHCGTEIATKVEPVTNVEFDFLASSTTKINYGDTLVLHSNMSMLPAGASIKWTVDGSGVTLQPIKDGLSCEVTSVQNGSVIVTATIIDENEKAILDASGNEVSTSQQIDSKVNFWQKIISFFKNLFGISRMILQ